MPFKTPSKTSEYIRELLREDARLAPISKYADEKIIPVLLPETAALLKTLVRLKKPAKVLEIGTAIGYSGNVILLNSDAKLYTIEANEASIAVAERFFEQNGLSSRVKIFTGDESEIVPLITGGFDLIFMDGAKTRYIEHLPYLKKLLNKEGLLVCDNVLFNGMVAGENTAVGTKASIVNAMRAFLNALMSDADFDSCILPVGDGVSVSIKRV